MLLRAFAEYIRALSGEDGRLYADCLPAMATAEDQRGPVTAAGIAAMRAGKTTHGRSTPAAILERRQRAGLWKVLRHELDAVSREAGLTGSRGSSSLGCLGNGSPRLPSDGLPGRRVRRRV
jgi:hypothetical protein